MQVVGGGGSGVGRCWCWWFRPAAGARAGTAKVSSFASATPQCPGTPPHHCTAVHSTAIDAHRGGGMISGVLHPTQRAREYVIHITQRRLGFVAQGRPSRVRSLAISAACCSTRRVAADQHATATPAPAASARTPAPTPARAAAALRGGRVLVATVHVSGAGGTGSLVLPVRQRSSQSAARPRRFSRLAVVEVLLGCGRVHHASPARHRPHRVFLVVATNLLQFKFPTPLPSSCPPDCCRPAAHTCWSPAPPHA